MSFLEPEGYTPEDDGPEARNYREQMARQEKDQAVIERLLAELRPHHARQPLISWANIQKWKLKRRSKPS